MFGKVVVIIGPVGSGKTTSMLVELEKYKAIGKRTVCIKDSETITTEDGLGRTHDFTKYKCISVFPDCLKSFIENTKTIDDYDVIGIDEGQFFSGISGICEFLCNKKGKIVIISALLTDCELQEFKETTKLLLIADEILYKRGICKICKLSESCFSKKIKNTKNAKDPDNYFGVCKKCFYLSDKIST